MFGSSHLGMHSEVDFRVGVDLLLLLDFLSFFHHSKLAEVYCLTADPRFGRRWRDTLTSYDVVAGDLPTARQLRYFTPLLIEGTARRVSRIIVLRLIRVVSMMSVW